MGILDTSKKATFPDVPENHWAYEYVSTLVGNGILTGYPDGTFKGGQDMTRYELAAVFYRAMQNGAVNDATLQRGLKEFSPEISDIRNSRVRVDRISGEDHERGKVERVRINNNDTANVKYDVYGSII